MAWNQNDEQRKVQITERWDEAVFKPHMRPIPRFMEDEDPDKFRKRLMDRARPLVDEELQKIKTTDIFGSALDHVENQFLASAAQEAVRPRHVPEGTLKEVKRQDATGRPFSEFYGSPKAWLDNFGMPKRRLAGVFAPALSDDHYKKV